MVITTVLLLLLCQIADDVAQSIDSFGIIVIYGLINIGRISGFKRASVVIPFLFRYFSPYCSNALCYRECSVVNVPVEIENDMGMTAMFVSTFQYPEISCQV